MRASNRAHSLATCAALFVLAASAAPRARAEPPAAPPRAFPRFDRGAQQLGAVAGYGLGLDIGERQSGDVRLVAASAGWGVALTRPYAADRWCAGSLSLLLEGEYLHTFDPNVGDAGMANALLRLHFVALERFVPFAELGAGIGGIDFDVAEQRDGFNFAVMGGLGAQLFLVERAALTLEWRLHHISNAGTRPPNLGINTTHFLAGFSAFFG